MPIRFRCGATRSLCGASKVSVVPTGDLWITGFYGESPYVRGCWTRSA